MRSDPFYLARKSSPYRDSIVCFDRGIAARIAGESYLKVGDGGKVLRTKVLLSSEGKYVHLGSHV